MKKWIFSFCVGLITVLGLFNLGCYGRVEHVGVGVEVEPHDAYWHYHHDYDDEWRSHHPWRGDHWE